MAKQILIVDDEPNILRLLRVNLERAGFEVCSAGNGQEALDRLAVPPPVDFLVTDVMMPIMHGIELVTKVRRQPSLVSPPVIMLLAKAADREPPDHVHFYRMVGGGATDFLYKPFNPPDLVRTVQAAFAGAQFPTFPNCRAHDADSSR